MKNHLLLIAGLLIATLEVANATSSVAQNSAQTASVTNSCVIKTVGNISFGNYVVSQPSPLLGSGSVKLICTKNATVSTIPTNGGTVMTGSGGNLSYGLFTDSGYSKPWTLTGGSQNVNSSPVSLKATYNSQLSKISGVANISLSACMAQVASQNVLLFYWPGNGCYKLDPNGPSYAYTVFSSTGAYQNQYTTIDATGKVLYAGQTSPGDYWILPTGSTINSTTGTYTYPISTASSNPITSVSTSSLTEITQTYYAKIPANQDLAPGVYVDTVTIQISF